MDTASLFKNGQSQAVRLPKSCRLKGRKVRVKKVGHAVLIYPVGKEWEVFDQGLKMFSSDFMEERGQPVRQQKRRNPF